jgi:hypothetical protein
MWTGWATYANELEDICAILNVIVDVKDKRIAMKRVQK